jgi:hypothetical protein
VRPAAAGEAAGADHLAGSRLAREAGADFEPLGVFVFASVRFAALRRVQEKSSAPQSRLVCIHLQSLLGRKMSREKKSNSTAARIKTKNRQERKNQRRANAN